MKEVILGTVCLLAGVLIGRFTTTPTTVTSEPIEKIVEKIVEKPVEVQVHGTPVKIMAMEGVEDLRPARNAVNATVVFDKEVPNSYGLLVVDLKHGGKVKLKITDNHGPGFNWGGPVSRLHTQFSPKQLGLEANDFAGLTARFYSSDFPPELWKK